jgi:hypothetical protein
MEEDPRTRDETTTTDERERAMAASTTDVDDEVVTLPEAPTEGTEREPDVGPDDRTSLLEADTTTSLRRRWEEIQAGFVDRPRESVEQADRLVIELVQQLQASFTNERDRLESEWREGSDVSTEDLRVALTRYRSFFDRLLST